MTSAPPRTIPHDCEESPGRAPRLQVFRRVQCVSGLAQKVRFASRGGMIRFVTDHNRIRLRINLEAARAANLTLSSKLLRPAQIVRRGED